MAEGDLSVFGSAEETNRVLVESGELFRLGVLFDRALPDVEASAFFGEVEELLIVNPDGIAVLADEVGDLAM
ncbi:MAG: hypothetical protein CMO60_06690 [Verrucomicrobiales bacterium]|nr:hypothetical protein [Verrucomicrobiales bacterium]